MKRIFLSFAFLVSCAASWTLAQAPASLSLRSGSLEIELENPGTVGSHQGTRFDRSGIMTRIQFGMHQLCSRWHTTPPNPNANDDVAGPTEEFGNSMALGFSDAKVGESFLKIGVGKLQKDSDKAYSFFHPYKIVEPGTWASTSDGTTARFEQSLAGDRGSSYRYIKQIVIRNDGWDIAHELTNTGTVNLESDHYNHNFFLVDGDMVGPHYELTFPFEVEPYQPKERFSELIRLRGSQLTFHSALESGSIFSELRGHTKTVRDAGFSLKHATSGVEITCHGDTPLTKYNLWGVARTICPEPYIQILLEPKQSKKWTWSYKLTDSIP